MAALKEFKPGFDYIAKTFAGLEEALLKELIELGADDTKVIKRGVSFRGDDGVLFKANYLARTALRVLKPIGVFEVNDAEQLYEKVGKINWQSIFKLEQTFNVNAHVFNSELDHSQFVALKSKDAIVDQFRASTGKRPWVGKEDADIYIDVHLSGNVCTISLDSSGESLHKRGYRIDADKAPINEVLAAGMVELTGWKGDKDLYDPMCGSATIPIEAAMMAMSIPPGYYRKRFAFMNWEGFNEALWIKVKKEADEKIKELDCQIYASDRSRKAIDIAKRNLKNAGLHKDIDLSVKYFDAIEPEIHEGILIFNPPYGNRLEERNEIKNLYRGVGDVLKNNFSGFVAWLITANLEAAKFIGLRPSARIELYNGPLESRLLKFDLYQGSKKNKYEKDHRKPDKEWKKDRKESDGKYDKRTKGKSFKRPEKENARRDTGVKRAFKNPYKDDRELDWKKERVSRGSKFIKSDDDKSQKRSHKPDWKTDKDNRLKKRQSDTFKGPQLGKPDRTEYTGDGKKGSRKKRPRL